MKEIPLKPERGPFKFVTTVWHEIQILDIYQLHGKEYLHTLRVELSDEEDHHLPENHTVTMQVFNPQITEEEDADLESPANILVKETITWYDAKEFYEAEENSG